MRAADDFGVKTMTENIVYLFCKQNGLNAKNIKISPFFNAEEYPEWDYRASGVEL